MNQFFPRQKRAFLALFLFKGRDISNSEDQESRRLRRRTVRKSFGEKASEREMSDSKCPSNKFAFCRLAFI